MLHTLRARVTALATGITLAVCLLVCTTLYLGMRHSLYEEVDSFLAGEVMEFRAILTAADGDLAEVQRGVRAQLGSRQRGDLTFRLLDAQGNVLLTSETAAPRIPPWGVPDSRFEGMLLRTDAGADGAPTRTCSERIVDADGQIRIVQATYLLDQVDDSLRRFRRVCGAALLLAVVLAALGGRLLAVRGLRPVAVMARAARVLSVEDLSARLERTCTCDELDQLGESFNALLGRLERHVLQLRQFTADAAHELRTPLAALRGNAEIALSRSRSPDELRAVLAESIEEYDRLARIANDLLLLARADAGQQFITRQPFRLDRALGDLVDLFTPSAEERQLELDCPARPETWIDGDDGRLRQAIANLLDNAIKFTPAGGCVRVELHADEHVARVTVRDTGIGIAPEHLEHVADRFYRADTARARGGAGLGLSICRTIVLAHRGSFRIESELGAGTQVVVQLPTLRRKAPAGPLKG